MKAALVGVGVALVAVGPAHADPFLQLHQEGHWYFEAVEGPSTAVLKPVTGGPRARCRLEPQPAVGAIERAKLICEPSGAASAGRFAALVAHERALALDAAGLRELRRPSDDPAQLADRSNAGAFTFPKQLPAAGAWSHDAKGADGARVQIAVRTEAATVLGKPETLWIADARSWRPGATAPERAVAALVPGGPPALLCTVDAAGAHSCLRVTAATADERKRDLARLAIDAPGDPTADLDTRRGESGPVRPPRPAALIALAGKRAHDRSSLKAEMVATKIAALYVAGMRRCYRDLLRGKPAARGKLEVTFTVNAVGKAEDGLAKAFDDTLAACIQPQMASWRFPIPMSDYSEPRTARFTLHYKLTPD